MKVVIILVVSIFIGMLLYFNFKGKLNKKNISLLGILLLFSIILMCVYNYFLEDKTRQYSLIITAFDRGDTLECGEIAVNNTSFTFTNGTLSFMGKQGTKYYYKSIYIDECSVKND